VDLTSVLASRHEGHEPLTIELEKDPLVQNPEPRLKSAIVEAHPQLRFTHHLLVSNDCRPVHWMRDRYGALPPSSLYRNSRCPWHFEEVKKPGG